MQLSAVPGTLRVRRNKPFTGTPTAAIACARGEYESFQVIVSAPDRSVQGVQAELQSLRNADGVELPAEGVVLFCEIAVPVRHSAPRATCPPGLIPRRPRAFRRSLHGRGRGPTEMDRQGSRRWTFWRGGLRRVGGILPAIVGRRLRAERRRRGCLHRLRTRMGERCRLGRATRLRRSYGTLRFPKVPPTRTTSAALTARPPISDWTPAPRPFKPSKTVTSP